MNERLKNLRESKNLLQKDVAKELGITKSAYSNYEQGIRFPTYDILIKICKFYNVSADYLLGLTDYI